MAGNRTGWSSGADAAGGVSVARLRAADASRPPVALITGASAGIGVALARLIAADGYDLVLVARRRERLEALANELGTGRTTILAADLADPGGCASVGEALAALGRPVRVLVNNAGFGTMAPVVRTDPAELAGMIDLNVRALVDLTRRVLPDMLAARAGGILNVASTAAFQPGPGMATYYATKAFVLSFSEALSAEVAGSGVTVTALCPGPTRTEFQARGGMDRSPLFTRLPTMTAEEVARIGWTGFRRDRRVVVTGLANRIGAAVAPFVPRSMLLPLVRRINAVPKGQSG